MKLDALIGPKPGAKQERGFLRSGELARLARVSPDTLRHYERLGLIARPRRSANGYREYPPETLERVLLVQRALAIGFTLKELARCLKVRDTGGVPCSDVRRLATEKLQEIERQIASLSELGEELRSLLLRWDVLLANLPEGATAGLLESLGSNGESTKEVNRENNHRHLSPRPDAGRRDKSFEPGGFQFARRRARRKTRSA